MIVVCAPFLSLGVRVFMALISCYQNISQSDVSDIMKTTKYAFWIFILYYLDVLGVAFKRGFVCGDIQW